MTLTVGHVALIDLVYMHTKFHFNRTNFLWTDKRRNTWTRNQLYFTLRAQVVHGMKIPQFLTATSNSAIAAYSQFIGWMNCFQNADGCSRATVKAVADVIGVSTRPILHHHLTGLGSTRQELQLPQLVYTTDRQTDRTNIDISISRAAVFQRGTFQSIVVTNFRKKMLKKCLQMWTKDVTPFLLILTYWH